MIVMGCAKYTPSAFNPRVVADTRQVVRIGLTKEAATSLTTLWRKSVRDSLEQGGCLYGIVKDSLVAIQEVLPPIIEAEKSDTTIYFDCKKNDKYLGTAHTHFWNRWSPSEQDITKLMYDDYDGILMVLFGDSRATVITRELGKAFVDWSK